MGSKESFGVDAGVLLEAIAASSAEQPSGGVQALAGHLTGIDDEGRLLFQPDGQDDAFAIAIGVALPDEELAQAARQERRVLVLMVSDSPRRGILIGLLRERVGAEARESAQSAGGVNVKVDGKTVRISADNEIELRCGKSRLLLHKDGRVEISGNHLISRSRGPVKIKGATIALN